MIAHARASGEVIIAGVGNLLLMDDGVGVHAVRAMSARPEPGVRIIDAGTAIFHIVDDVSDAYRILVIDAVLGAGSPGSVYSFDAGSVEREEGFTSLHSLSLLNALSLLSGRADLPPVHVLGVHPEQIGYGTGLSPSVSAALPTVIDRARRIVRNWVAETAWADKAECHS